MAKARPAAAAGPGETRRLVGYRLLRGFVLYQGRRHRALLRGEIVAADDAIVPLLFRNGAAIEPVME